MQEMRMFSCAHISSLLARVQNIDQLRAQVQELTEWKQAREYLTPVSPVEVSHKEGVMATVARQFE